jgi:glycosyltransferase involved in cell wall biosynthesis
MLPAISIIVPCFNVAHKFHAAPGLRGQFEIILVDDGSTDSGRSMMEGLGRVLSTSNQGPGAARNLGLKHATGDYVWFVDADDRIDPGPVERHRAKFTADVVSFNGGGYDLSLNMRDRYPRAGPWTAKLYKRSFLGENRIEFAESFGSEDNYFALQVAELFRTQQSFPETIYEVLHTSDSISRGTFNPRFVTRWDAVEKMLQFARAHPREGLAELEEELIFLSLGLTWSYYLERGRTADLLRQMPHFVARIRRWGLLGRMPSFLNSGSLKNRALKHAPITSPVTYSWPRASKAPENSSITG